MEACPLLSPSALSLQVRGEGGKMLSQEETPSSCYSPLPLSPGACELFQAWWAELVGGANGRRWSLPAEPVCETGREARWVCDWRGRGNKEIFSLEVESTGICFPWGELDLRK